MRKDPTVRFIDRSLPSVAFASLGSRSVPETCITCVIMHSRGRPASFQRAVDSLARTCTSLPEVELLVKVDSDDACLSEYLNILESCPFVYKLLVYNRLNAYWSVHIFQNDLSKIAHGTVLWCFNEDNEIISGDWVRAFRETRNIFADNIYVVQVPGSSKSVHKTVAPAYSIEWFNVLGIVSPHIYSDYFLNTMASNIGRFLSTKQVAKIRFEHHDKKTGRPRINQTHQGIKAAANVQINMHLPRFQEAIS